MLMKTLHSIIKWTVRAINYQDFWGNFTHLSCGLAGCGPQYKMILTSLLYTKYTAYQRTERPPPPALKKTPTHTKKTTHPHTHVRKHTVSMKLFQPNLLTHRSCSLAHFSGYFYSKQVLIT